MVRAGGATEVDSKVFLKQGGEVCTGSGQKRIENYFTFSINKDIHTLDEPQRNAKVGVFSLGTIQTSQDAIPSHYSSGVTIEDLL